MMNEQSMIAKITTGKCIRCACKAEGEEKSAGFVCHSCDDIDGDITGEENRIDAMPDVIITGYWRDTWAQGTYACKIGEYLEELNDQENESDQSIFYYFESIESITKGTGEFVVTSYQTEERTVKLGKTQIRDQVDHDPLRHQTVSIPHYAI